MGYVALPYFASNCNRSFQGVMRTFSFLRLCSIIAAVRRRGIWGRSCS